MNAQLICILLALWSCQNTQHIQKNGALISRLSNKDIFEQVVYHQDTLTLHYRAVVFENDSFDTLFIDVCNHRKFDTHPVLMSDVIAFFDNNKQFLARNLIYTSCAGSQETIKIAKGAQQFLFVEMPDFDLNTDSTKAIWGFEFFYMAYNYNVMVDSAGYKLQKSILISSGEKNFQNKPAFEKLPGYKY